MDAVDCFADMTAEQVSPCWLRIAEPQGGHISVALLVRTARDDIERLATHDRSQFKVCSEKSAHDDAMSLKLRVEAVGRR